MKNIRFFFVVPAFVFMGSTALHADDTLIIPRGSIAPKFIVFFPNNDSDGMKGFGTGLGAGVEGRFTIVNTEGIGIQIGPEIDYIGLSTYKETIYDPYYGSATLKGEFSTIKARGNFILLAPVRNVSFFFGGGLVYNSATFTFSNSGSITVSGSGLGGQILGGLDVLLGRGAMTVEITIPLAQKHKFEYSGPGGTLSVDVNIGGIELNIGYRFYF